MTQQNILKLLKRKKKWLTSKQIATYLKITPGNALVGLKKLFKQGIILRKTMRVSRGLFGGVGFNPYYWRIK